MRTSFFSAIIRDLVIIIQAIEENKLKLEMKNVKSEQDRENYGSGLKQGLCIIWHTFL